MTSRETYVEQYPAVFKSELGSLDGPVRLHVDENITPTVLSATSFPVALRQAVKTELQHIQDFEVITPVEKSTPWVSQMVTVVKKDSSVHLCIDLHPLNAALSPADLRRSPSRFRQETKVFSKVDLKSGY